DAVGGCDGIKNGKWGFHTASGEQDPWWQVDLASPLTLDRVVVFNRTDNGTTPRTQRLRVLTSLDGNEFTCVYEHTGEPFYGVEKDEPLVVSLGGKHVQARYVRLHIPGKCSFALDEVEVYATEKPDVNVALGKPADQKSVGPYSHPGTLGESSRTGAKAHSGCSLVRTRDIVDRAKVLAARLELNANPQRLQPLAERLMELDALVSKLERNTSLPEQVREDVYVEACGLRRAVAFTNPLLNFERLLFIKRHDSKGVFHMCDQYYGFNSVPGGGLFVLSDPFGPSPGLTNLLENSVVESGRLTGQKLDSGTFLSPELSFDGKTILFAYSEAKGGDLEWTPESSYHLFKVNADGTGLVQLTDGPWDDFDPCFLPGGRVAFITERRGGYLRCGRHCPVYTTYSMNDDGSDILCLSFHETHEWQPSVTNDGMLVYTRWDYVDRDTNVAHHIWTSYPDGRDPRSFHGNYPEKRETRP
ncbi:MAG: hypothetical protein GY851_14330, partial [bacterium]|nr:hypothetical protein [bacterium]